MANETNETNVRLTLPKHLPSVKSPRTVRLT